MPTPSSIHQNAALTNYVQGIPAQGFIAPSLLPDLSVKKKSDVYYIFDAGRDTLRAEDDKREPGALAKEVDFKMTSDSYVALGHALAGVVTDEELENADAPVTPFLNKSKYLAEKLMLGQEIDLKTKLDAGINSGSANVTLTGGDQWSDYDNSDPVSNVNAAISAIEDNLGVTPNVMAMDSKVWRKLKNHPAILERVMGMGRNDDPARIGRAAVASIFDLDEIIVASARKNTTLKNKTASLSRIWSTDVYIAYRTGSGGLRVPNLGYRFVWAPFTGAMDGWKVKRWREEGRGADKVQVEKYYVQKICLAGAGYRIAGAIA